MSECRCAAQFPAREMTVWVVLLVLTTLATGCSFEPTPDFITAVRQEARTCIERGMVYPFDPAVRAQAMEAASKVLGDSGRLRIREGLKDQHPGVRFAAAMALGKLRDKAAVPAMEALTNDPDVSVRLAAYFALEQCGLPTTERRTAWRDHLRKHENPEVRRNAVLALGQLGDRSTVPLLRAAASGDSDEGVRTQALEGLAMLGDKDAISRFIFEAFGGVGYRQPFAVMTLGQVPDDRVVPILRSRLASSPYLEAKLAAARGLGAKGYADGLGLAMRSLDWNKPDRSLAEDRPENQIMRVRSMAAMALGEIGDPRALGMLKKTMENPEDPRVQLAAATAILMIVDREALQPSVR
ncbi:MAG TPA: HEAT repeat domain-containing protein [Phycisphaerae bacterium]|nr:HEAT repeat domain-containing protein [Phycisphaerae bacterium]HRR85004.1 HEAT repeat domain-containing protein [Phycisphaerae bacterium]